MPTDTLIDVYATEQGDTWDLIAFKVYGDERYMEQLLDANPGLVHIAIFPGDVRVICPDIKVALPESLPPWVRTGE